MGPYCQYCDHRCFVPRIIPDGPRAGERLILATCPAGMAHDRDATGHDHTTATNPTQVAEPGDCSCHGVNYPDGTADLDTDPDCPRHGTHARPPAPAAVNIEPPF